MRIEPGDRDRSYLWNIDSCSELKRKILLDIDGVLSRLDEAAWEAWSKKATALLLSSRRRQLYEPFFDHLVEARAYNYLLDIGAGKLRLVPKQDGVKTPDLEGFYEGRTIICEAKAINVSEAELMSRRSREARSTSPSAGAPLLHKIIDTFQEACRQTASIERGTTVQRMVYIWINLDDGLHEYVDAILDEIVQTFAAYNLSNHWIALEAFPTFLLFYPIQRTSTPIRDSLAASAP